MTTTDETRERQPWERVWPTPYGTSWRVKTSPNDVRPRYFTTREEAQAYADECNAWDDPAYRQARG